jgi:hypothetical protein
MCEPSAHRNAPVPTKSVRRAALTSLCALALVGCQNEQPRVATSFRISRLERVAIGAARADVIAALGDPLRLVSAKNNVEMLVYAQPGARWWLGEYRTNVRGFDCTVWLRDGKVAAARVADPISGLKCACTAEACPATWFKTCLAIERP